MVRITNYVVRRNSDVSRDRDIVIRQDMDLLVLMIRVVMGEGLEGLQCSHG